jgi:tRNA dimethylallyltransferase
MKHNQQQSVHIVTGPTASGKSHYAQALAHKLNGVIINADSMQIYQKLPLITAQPLKAIKRQVDDGMDNHTLSTQLSYLKAHSATIVPHLLYGHQSLKDTYSVGHWLTDVQQVIDTCFALNKTPIVVGGTGLYITTLLNGLSSIPTITDSYRQQAAQALEKRGYADLSQKMTAIDPTFDPSTKNPRRLTRAYEVWLQTGRPLSYFWDQPKTKLPYQFDITVCHRERADLYERIETRFDHMITLGALNEVKILQDSTLPADCLALKAIGAIPLLKHLKGDFSLTDAKDQAVQDSRRYAKRQLTWMRHQLPKDAKWIDLKEV